MPPPKVEVATVIQRDVPVTGTRVATLDGYTNAQIQPQVSGYVIKQNYLEGSAVNKDDVLFEIDPRPFQAVLNQAKGQLSQARGQLAQAEAQLGLAQINVKRDTPLADARAIARSQLDTELQTQKTAQAAIQTAEATIESAQANVETAELNLGFHKGPVADLLDDRERGGNCAAVQLGNLIGPQTVLTTVSQVNHN